MADLTKEKIIDTLKAVKFEDGSNIIDRGVVSEVVIANGKVYFAMDAGTDDPAIFEPLCRQAEELVSAMEGVTSVGVTVTAERRQGEAHPAQAQKPQNGNGHAGQQNAGQQNAGQGGPQAGGQKGGQELPGVKHIIAVASGKGGVGKSTTSVNLALGLKALGLKVGILDADVYGPSMPRLLGISAEPQVGPENQIMALEAYGIKVMSMGFMVAEGTPVVWRGPMVMSALGQMLGKVNWAPLDVLVIDMPPGTGDVQLTIAQQTPLAGAVIVSTPQDLALIDARKGIAMFGQVNIPILGIVENMSYFNCPKCGERSDIFGHGGAREEARKIGTEFLGEVPLNMSIRETSDAGRPIMATDPESAEAIAYLEIAKKVLERIGTEGHHAGFSAPNIVIE
ncbi:MAG: iron-sulfur cluster carrier protein [Rhodomicrobium sp.]|nr:MAG: iron-sulfur cluster carrier protein [Rhodomicrobium sp.]